MISANQGIFSGGSLSVVNKGHSSGATSAIFVTRAAIVRNTGTISATSTAVFIDGLARVSDLLSGLAGADVVRGQNGADEMFGGDSNDQLFGGSQRDSLNGNAGNDRLSGGTDVDRLAGGAGDAIFVFVAFEEFRALSGSGRDLIVDFTPGEDLIDLSEPDANAGTAGDQAFRFQGTSPVNAFGQFSYRFVGGTTVISIGYDTPETFDVLISNGQIPLSPPDFVL